MKAILELFFDNTKGITCEKCMLSFAKASLDGESKYYCAALGQRPRCKEKGKRQDCPLKT